METITENVTNAVVKTDPEISNVLTALGGITPDKLLQAGLTLVIGFIMIRTILLLIRKVIEQIPNTDKTVTGFLISSARIIMLLVLLTIFFSTLGIPVTSLIAIISMFALAVSLSLQNILSNVVSGIVILMTRPFSVGDWIETPSTAGTVEQIDLIYTHLLSVDLKRIMVPNSELSASKITNYSNVKYRKILLNLRIGYEAENKAVIAALLRAAERAVQGHDTGTDKAFAATNAYKADGVEYILRVPILTKEYWEIYYDLLILVREELAKDGIKMDYSTTKIIGPAMESVSS